MAACAPSVSPEAFAEHIALNCRLSRFAAFFCLLCCLADCILQAFLPACASGLPEKEHGDCLWHEAVPSMTSSVTALREKES